MSLGRMKPAPPRDPGRGRTPPALARLAARPQGRQATAGYVVATVGTVALTLCLLPFRDSITPLAKGFGYLVVVVIAAAIGGLWPGLVASVFGFLLFNFFFLPPYNTLLIGRGEYVVVLFVFLGLSVLISALLARATERAAAAEARAAELRALQSLSAELVAAVPGEESYRSVLSLLLALFGFAAGALYVQDPATRDLREVVTVGADLGTLSPRWNPASDERPPERLPLSVGGRNLGLFVLRSDRPELSPAESRVLRAFCDEFALVLERDRLLHAATEAEVYRQSDQVRRSLLAAVSHDLRTPLAAIKASVTDLLATDTTHGADYAREVLESVDQETDRLAALIANLLDMSRIEGGMIQARPQGVDLPEVLSACVDRALRHWHGLGVTTQIPDGAQVVRADPVFLDRVVANLLDNAARAALESGENAIEVEARREADAVTVRIIDHGPGVPPSVREQLFYPFYQLSERHPRLGTGLGLPISKGFLHLMEGDIWIEDTPGGGATFAFSIPAGAPLPSRAESA
jgi:two-component system, OmpR family, sensor histidine kinase KdpD